LEGEITGTGRAIHEALGRVLALMPDPTQGPQGLARRTGVDKVLASRVLKAMRSADPVSVLVSLPGPEPLRRLVRGAAAKGVERGAIAAAEDAIDRFERLIRDEIGDRSTLDTIVSRWVPDARRAFELRRKQAAFKAMSQLKGVQARTTVSTVFLHPTDGGQRLDIVWLNGLIGLQRLRREAPVKFATRRVAREGETRRPRTLDGQTIDDLQQGVLAAFSSADPRPRLHVQRAGEVNHYTLAGGGFGPRTAVDLVCAEVNLDEMSHSVPRGSGRKGYVFAELSIPSEVLQFDAFVHEGVYPASEPKLRLYDTAFEGVADANDPSRDIDRLDVLESIHALGHGLSMCRSSDVPRYYEMVSDVFERLGWDPAGFRGYRCRIDYPIYGSQTVMVFDPPEAP
jgi:hypothetical protein